MISKLYRMSLLALYQLTVALGILVMPLAMLARRAGLRLPIHRIVEAADRAYENAAR
jgi:hypothetical protein